MEFRVSGSGLRVLDFWFSVRNLGAAFEQSLALLEGRELGGEVLLDLPLLRLQRRHLFAFLPVQDQALDLACGMK